jgi:hypothetical protein
MDRTPAKENLMPDNPETSVPIIPPPAYERSPRPYQRTPPYRSREEQAAQLLTPAVADEERSDFVGAGLGSSRTASVRTSADAVNVGYNASPGAAARASVAREEETPDDVMTRTRVSRDQRESGRYDVPAHMKKPGWDYQWCTVSIIGQPADASDLTIIQEAGWRPEVAKNWPGYVPMGSDPNAPVTRFGQVLHSRPMSLTIAAREEEYIAAITQMRDKIQGAFEGRLKDHDGLADIHGIVRKQSQLEIFGEAGVAPLRQRG